MIRKQEKILAAYKDGNMTLVRRLQGELVRSLEAIDIAINTVMSNKGGKTPGIDGIIDTDELKSKAKAELKSITLNGNMYKASPVRRVGVEKPGKKEKRPLGIPTMIDRAYQKLGSLALSPIAEFSADVNSYGGRPNKSTHDAIEKLHVTLNTDNRNISYVLEGDIKGFFDNISKKWILKHIPIDSHVLSEGLNAGVLDKNEFQDSGDGVPQGGIISPMIANMALDGLEVLINTNLTKAPYIVTVRYMDDFVVTGSSVKQLKGIQSMIETGMGRRGLQLHQDKTVITAVEDGFDFLGVRIAVINKKVVIKPQVKAVNRLVSKVRNLANNDYSTVFEYVSAYNAIVRGGANYYQGYDVEQVYYELNRELGLINNHWMKKKFMNIGAKRIFREHYVSDGSKWGGTAIKATGKDADGKILTIKSISILNLGKGKSNFYKSPKVPSKS